MMDALTLDQFATFAAVVDEGSFAAAARRMGRAQSAITYAVQKLEEQSGTALFDRSQYRPRLTDAGQALLPHARRILTDLDRYRAHARAMTAGVESEVRLILPDSMPPMALVAALAELRTQYPSVQLRITTDAAVTALRSIDAGTVDLAVMLNRPDLPAWFTRAPCTRVKLIAVTARDHPLAAATAPIAPETLADHLQIVVTRRAAQDAGADQGVVAVNRWYVTDYAVKRDLLLAGLGWGSMPEHLVAADLVQGRLVRLEALSWDGAPGPPTLQLVVGMRANRFHGPAARLLLAALSSG
ncbi:LysR family transcriptional regulator [Novosphingobium sp. BL-52-GroH]|uniref:LysR family transcriptional regulator n=1 Tax=Novosphingobium sp. BL-52-GroH TaxID=3349877 RepID=UPI003851458D